MPLRSASIADGVNALLTRRRSRVWSGGSRLRIVLAPPAAPGTSPFEDRIVTRRGVGVDVAAEVVAAQRARHVVVPGDDRQADRRHVRRRLGAQPVVEGVRVRPERRVERVVHGRSVEPRAGPHPCRPEESRRRPSWRHVYTAAASATASTTRSIWSSVITSGGQNVSVSAPMARTTTPSCCIRSRIALASWSARRPTP